MRVLYEVLLALGLLAYLPKAFWRRRLPHPSWSMRLGRYPDPVLRALRGRPVIWIHAVSVGEVVAIQPLVRELLTRLPGHALVMSTVTPTGFAVASKLLEGRGTPIYAPLDFRLTVRRALAAIRPSILLLVESELWPNLIRLTKQQGIPIAVINGRISARAFRRYRLIRAWMRSILADVDLLLMQTELDAARLLALGAVASRVKVLGSLKWDASLLARPAREATMKLAERLRVGGDQPVIVAGSTHRGEEDTVLDAFQRLHEQMPSVKLILAPRHPERAGEVEELARQRGVTAILRASTLDQAPPAWDVALVDTMGQLPLYYALASVVFVGGSLIPHGGQNPLEAASLGKPIVFGPSMENFAEITHQLRVHQAACQVADRAQLTPTLQRLVGDPEEARLMGARAQALVERLSGVSRRTLESLKPLLPSSF